MAAERTIRISAELDTAGILTSLNKIKQNISSMSVDSGLFKDVNKDIDKIYKILPAIMSNLKNGIPESGVKGFLKNIETVTALYQQLPQKIKQVQISANDLRLSDTVITQIDDIDTKVRNLSNDINKILGDSLKTNIKDVLGNAFGIEVISKITKAEDKIGTFREQIELLNEKASKTKQELQDTFAGLSQTLDSKKGQFKNKQIVRDVATEMSAGLAVPSKIFSEDEINRFRDALASVNMNYEQTIKTIRIYNEAKQALNQQTELETRLNAILNQSSTSAEEKRTQIVDLLNQKEQILNSLLQEQTNKQNSAAASAQQLGTRATAGLNRISESAQHSNAALQKQDSILRQLYQRATMLIGIGAIFNYITRAVRSAWSGIKELDKEFTQIAVVTSNTTSQLWASFSTYSQMAQRLGVATKDAVATSALYYQQGLKTNEVMSLTTETIKMAQIAGMDFATATNQMTAAIRGFNLEMNQASLVNDIFSTLAANAAVSTQELSYALTKTASIADSAGMSIENTSAFLTKMIETTREAPENIGTAMKSIVARFQELKQNPLALKVEVEGEEVVANKVEAAIALAGVKLRDASGQFRNLDDVFLELAKSWDGLDRNTQRYIATIAAGSRQQSRFIALMEGYDRTLELTELAQDSEGQSAAQFLKTLDSLDSKLNKIRNSLEALYQKFVNSDFFGGLLDSLNNLIQGFSKWDGTTLAMFLTAGVVIGNNIITGLKTALSKENLFQNINFQNKLDNFLPRTINFANKKGTNGIIDRIAEQRQDTYKDLGKSLNEKYNIDVSDSLQKLNQVQAKIDVLEKKMNEPDNYNINTEMAQKELDNLKIKRANIRNSIVNGLDSTTSLQVEQSVDNVINQGTQQIDTQMNQALKQRMQAWKVGASKQMQGIGTAMISSLTIGITQALNSDKPFEAIGSAFWMFALQTLPKYFGILTTAITQGMTAARAAFDTAGGWIAVALEFIAAVIAALSIAITAAIKNFKTEEQKLEEQIDKLKDKQKELQEESEKLNAEAAQEKTKNKKLDKLVDTYDELIKKTGRTTEENEKLNNTINDLATEFPDLIDYYDKAGNAVLKQRKEWEAIIQLQKETVAENMLNALAKDIELNIVGIQLQKAQSRLDTMKIPNSIYDQVEIIVPGGSGYDSRLLDEKKEIIQKRESVDYKNLNEVKSLRTDIGYINYVGTDYQATKMSKEDWLEFVSTPSNRFFQSVDEIKSYINDLKIDETGKDFIRKAFEKDQDAYLLKLQDLYNGVTEQIKELNPEYKSEEEIKEIEKVKSNLEKYFVQYISQFEPDLSKTYGEKGTQFFAEAYARQGQEALTEMSEEDYAEYLFKKIGSYNTKEDLKYKVEKIFRQETGQKLSDVYEQDEINKIYHGGGTVDSAEKFYHNMTQTDNAQDKETWALLQEIAVYMKTKEQNDNISDYIQGMNDLSNQIKLGNVDNQILELINSGQFGLYGQDVLKTFGEQLTDSLGGDHYVTQKFQKAIDQQVENLKLLPSGFKELGEKYGYDIAQGLVDKGAIAQQAKALEGILGTIKDQSKVSSIYAMITEDFDWGNQEGLVKLGSALIETGSSAEEAAAQVLVLKEILNQPINLTLNADKAIDDVTDVAKSLSEMRKGFKDLNSAVEEFNENGRLSTETVLELLENGQLMYLNYDKETKAITINKQAMADYFELQVAEAKLKMQMKKQEVADSIEALKQRRDNLVQQRDLLLKAAKTNNTITAKEYQQLLQLNSDYSQDSYILNKNIADETVDTYGNMWDQILVACGNGLDSVLQLIKSNSGAFQNALTNTLNGQEAAVTINGIEEARAKLKNAIENSKDLINNPSGMPSEIAERIAKGYEIQLTDAEIQALIADLDDQIKATDEYIAAAEKYQELIDQGIDTITALTESGLGKFLNDTASATKNASKELEDYISTLEKYYNLQKAIEKSSKETEKAKKTWERTGTLEDRKKYEDSLKKEARQRSQLAANYTGERDYDLQNFKNKLGQKYNISPEMIAKVGLDENGYLDANVLREILNQSLETMDKDTFEKLDKDINEALKEIEGDTDKINEQKEWFDNLIETEKEKLEKVKELKASLDKMSNIEQALESINKNFEDAKEQNELYYESGGKEGTDTLQMARVYAERQEGLTKANTAIKATQQDFLKTDEDYLKYKDYLTIGPDDKMYFDQDFFNKNFTGKEEEYVKVTNAIKDIKEEYNKYTDKINENTKALDKNAKELKEWQKSLRKSYSDLITRLADDMAKLDQKEIDEVKKKYAAIQAEDDKYLDSLQKSIDKQRRLRDQAKSYDDLEKQEKRLALLERDTSGANASEIATLREQIKDARQNLVDTEQDNIVNNISEKNTKRKEQMDEETQFLQNVMDERTYDMQYYLDKARDIVDAAINGDAGAFQQMLETMKKSEEAFFKVTKEAQDEWAEGLKSEFTKADGWKELTTKGFDAVGESIQGVKDKMQVWLDTDIGKSTFSTTMHNLEDYLKGVKLDGAFETMNSKINDTINCLEDLKNKVESLPNVEKDIVYKVRTEGDEYGGYPQGKLKENGEGQYIVSHYDNTTGRYNIVGHANTELEAQRMSSHGGQGYYINKELLSGIHSADNPGGLDFYTQKDIINKNRDDTYGEPNKNNENGLGYTSPTPPTPRFSETKIAKNLGANWNLAERIFQKQGYHLAWDRTDEYTVAKFFNENDELVALKNIPNEIYDKLVPSLANSIVMLNKWGDWEDKWSLNQTNKYEADKIKKLLEDLKMPHYLSGGLVDYTGLAWVDGTKSDPEAFLSADDVRNLRTLTEILNTVLSVPTSTPSLQMDKSTNSGDTNIEIHLDIDKIDSDYDVNGMLELMADKIAEASEGQVNIIRK